MSPATPHNSFCVLVFTRASAPFARPQVRQVPLFLTVAGWTALSYGSVFLLYALVSAIRAVRRAGYVEVNNREDSVFGDSVFNDTRDNLAEVARPGLLSSAMGCLMFIGELLCRLSYITVHLTCNRVICSGCLSIGLAYIWLCGGKPAAVVFGEVPVAHCAFIRCLKSPALAAKATTSPGSSTSFRRYVCVCVLVLVDV